jgi:hypothetical protein
MNAKEIVLQRLSLDVAEGIRLGTPQTAGSLTLIPVFHDGPNLEYLTYSEAVVSGLATMSEVDEAASVPKLVMRNAATRPVLLVEGEVIVGLKQNRVINTTILAAASTTTVIPVTCVEQGRWHNAVGAARKSDIHLSPGLRSRKNLSVAGSVRSTGHYAADQGEVWQGVADRLHRSAVESPTSSYDDIATQQAGRIKRFLDELRPAPGQCGVLVAVGGQPTCLDLFDRASTLEQLWAGLVGSYSIDALVDGRKGGAYTKRQAYEWLGAVGDAEATEHKAIGLGRTVALTSARILATALVVGAVAVHIGAFVPEKSEGAGPRFARPRQRRPRTAR